MASTVTPPSNGEAEAPSVEFLYVGVGVRADLVLRRGPAAGDHNTGAARGDRQGGGDRHGGNRRVLDGENLDLGCCCAETT